MKKNLNEKIITLLRGDARLTADKIAVMLGEDKRVVANEITTLEKSGVIVKYTAIINEEKVSSDTVEALIEVKVSPTAQSGFDLIAEKIYSFDEVKSVYLMSGAYDLGIRIQGKSLREVASFVSEKLSGIDKVISCATHFILKKYKTEGVVLDKDNGGKRQAVHA